MFKIISFDHIVLRSNNIERLLNFYVNILGCSIEKSNPEFGLTHLRAGDNLIDLLKIDSKVNEKNLEHFCLRINPFNYEDLKDYFNKYNIEVLRYGKRYSALGNTYSFYIKDPDGNEVEFIENTKSHIYPK